MQTPTNFTVSPSSQQGDVYGTEFVFNSLLPSNYTAFAWSLGDGIIEYNKSTVAHTYNYPGIYTVGLSAWTDEGLLYVDNATINVDYVYRDSVNFTKIPSSYGTPGLPTTEPFVVSLISSKIDQPLSIVLQAQNTKSVPHYAVPDKWSFLTPRWRFVDASTGISLDGPIAVSAIPIYKDSKVVAVSGQSSFYYIDDLATGTDPGTSCPLLVIATLSTERFSFPPEALVYPYASYSNSEVARAVITWQISDTIPTKLRVTENYLSEIYPIKWAGVPIPVMITCEFDPSLLEDYQETEAASTNVLAYPRTNDFGAASPVTLSLISNGSPVPSSYYKVDEPSLFFKATDEYGNIASGYIFTTITPLSPMNFDVQILASTIATNQVVGSDSFGSPNGVPVYPNVYISHPYKGTINRTNITTYPASNVGTTNTGCGDIEYYKDLGILIEGSVSFIGVPILSSTDLVNYELSGTSGVYGMAFNPVKNKLYACDADLGTIYSFKEGNTLTKTVYLSALMGTEKLTPCYASTDRYGNVWVSLYDNQKILKFDSDLNFLLSAVPNIPGPIDIYESGVGGGFGDSLIAPPIAETDKSSNVWACYAHPISGMLVKFDSNGNELLKASGFSSTNIPVSLAINVNNNVWVACRGSDSIKLYSTNGTLMSSVSGIIHPSYIAMDRSNNVWVTHGYNLCSVYDTRTNKLSTWKFATKPQTIDTFITPTTADTYLSFSENEIWGGLATDVYDRVWVINSVDNLATVFNSNDITTFKTYNVIPPADTDYFLKPGDNFVTNIPSDNVRSACAGGDWTGNRWYQKYANLNNSLPIEGISVPFRVYDINDSFQLTKVNEEFDCANYFQSLALPEILSQNTKLFDEFFAAVVGDGNPTQESAGRVIYERIANFVSNRGDFETAEIDELLSIAQSMAVDTKTFGSGFPVAVKRLLSIFSVPKQQLRGIPNLEADVANNIGPILTSTSLVTANKYYFAKDRRYDTYQLVYTNLFNGLSVYPLSDIDVEGFRQPVTDNYYFFEYNEQNSNGYTGNLINWDSDFTTISYNLSTNEEWYGDNGLVETMFNNLLTKQLYEP